MRRISIVGNTSTGKTTLARQLADDLGLTHIEMDGLFHGPDWTPTPPDEFQAKLHTAMQDANATSGGWTMCGNYRGASDRIGQKAADTIIWLDMPRWLIMRRVIARTVRRVATREKLWNGNREPLSMLFRWRSDENIIRWAWIKYHEYIEQGTAAMTDGTWAHATVHRLRSPAEVAKFRERATR